MWPILIFVSTSGLLSSALAAPRVQLSHNTYSEHPKNHGHKHGSHGHGATHAEATLVPLSHNQIVDYYAPPRYSYSYGVNDPHTHDMKTAYETRDGDYTHGRYSVMQPDGILRVVTYTADPWKGFQAEVKMLNGYAQHPPQHYYAPKTVAVAALPVVNIPIRNEVVYPHANLVKNVVVKAKLPVEEYGHDQGEVVVGQGLAPAYADYY